jgi:hypothetical protein
MAKYLATLEVEARLPAEIDRGDPTMPYSINPTRTFLLLWCKSKRLDKCADRMSRVLSMGTTEPVRWRDLDSSFKGVAAVPPEGPVEFVAAMPR